MLALRPARRRPRQLGLGRFLALATAGLVLPAAVVAAPLAAAAGTERATFVVVLDSAVEPRGASRDLARRHGGDVGFVYEHALNGFAITVAAEGAAGIARDRRVKSVERDQLFRTTAQQVPTGIVRSFTNANPNTDIDGADDARVDVDIAVIDTGLDSDHPDLNIAGGTDCTGGGPFKRSCANGTFEDANGHGTHVGGSAAALDNGIGVVGVAPGARLHGVRVLGNSGSGYTSWIIAGIEWVTARADVIEVANMSLGCECTSSAQDTAIANSVAAGVTYVVAAGNSDKDASTFNPANHPAVITVSALADFDGLAGGLVAPVTSPPYCRVDQDDTLADFSNFGSRVEIAAPGACILSTWLGGGYNTISGTSMASPHVAGAAALLASSRPSATPAQIRSLLVGAGNLNWTDDSGDGIKEPVLDVSDSSVFAPVLVGGGGGGGTTNAAPSAQFTSSCVDLGCAFDGSASSDSDGTISTYAWTFGDGSTASTATANHDYASSGSYTVTLTVTDNEGATATASRTVTVSAPSTGGMSLAASGYKVKGVQHVNLSWSGTSAAAVDVWRNGVVVATTGNDGAHTDNIGAKGAGSYVYRVCETGTSTCSNEVPVVF